MSHDWITPDWSAPKNVRALITTRNGGVSEGPYGTDAALNGGDGANSGGLNLGDHTGDDPRAVCENQMRLYQYLPATPVGLNQVHSATAIRLPLPIGATSSSFVPIADAVFTTQPRVVCQVRTADCLPVLFADRHGRVVGVAHAGWRGLASGVLEATVQGMRKALAMPTPESSLTDTDKAIELIAYLGPAISAAAFEVGEAVYTAFIRAPLAHPDDAAAFTATGKNKWHADLCQLARLRLQRLGITDISGGHDCTYSDAARFYSYRRDGVTGRMASCVWIEAAED